MCYARCYITRVNDTREYIPGEDVMRLMIICSRCFIIIQMNVKDDDGLKVEEEDRRSSSYLQKQAPVGSRLEKIKLQVCVCSAGV